MGKCTSFALTITDYDKATPTVPTGPILSTKDRRYQDALSALQTSPDVFFEADGSGWVSEPCYWDYFDPMLELSKTIPTVLFKLHCCDGDDIWDAYFQNGKTYAASYIMPPFDPTQLETPSAPEPCSDSSGPEAALTLAQYHRIAEALKKLEETINTAICHLQIIPKVREPSELETATLEVLQKLDPWIDLAIVNKGTGFRFAMNRETYCRCLPAAMANFKKESGLQEVEKSEEDFYVFGNCCL